MKTNETTTRRTTDQNAAPVAASYNRIVVNHIIMYADNTRDINPAREWLAACVAKDICRGLEPDRARLVKSSHLTQILKQAADLARRDEWCKVSKADEAQAREELADATIERAYEVAEDMKEEKAAKKAKK